MTLPAYDASKDPLYNSVPISGGVPRRVTPVTPSDTTDLTKYGQLLVTAAGNLAVVPVLNDDGTGIITLTGLSVGYVVPFQVRRVRATGTTASVAVLDKVF